MQTEMWINCVITLILACCTQSDAFWWPKTTTETREPSGGQMMQQIPLTYFRTYTYQPLAPGFFGFGAPQSPLLPGGVSHQYDPYAQVTSYAAARRHDSVARQEVTAPSSTTSTTSTTPAPTTTTTTTTTTTPAPTTSTTTTSTTTPPPPPQAPQTSISSSSSFSEGSTSSLLRFGEYPTYNRRVSNLYNSRPQYPYPDYFNYQPPAQQHQQQQEQGVASTASRIQFVPCMCPVSMPSLVSSSTAATAPPHLATSPSTAFVAQPAARHIERQELEAEADGETASEGEEEDEEEDVEEEQGQGQGQEEAASTSSIKPILD